MPSQSFVDGVLPPTTAALETLRKDLREDIQQEFDKLSTRLVDEIKGLFCQDAVHPSMIRLKTEQSVPPLQHYRQGCNPPGQNLGGTAGGFPSEDCETSPRCVGSGSSSMLDQESHDVYMSQSFRRYINEDASKQEQSVQNWLHHLTIKMKTHAMRGEMESDENSCLAQFVRNRVFTVISFSVLLANAIWMGYDSDRILQQFDDSEHSQSNSTYSLSRVSLTFSTFYAIEIVLKLIAFHKYFILGADWHWNILDLFLVLLSIPEYMYAVGNFNIFRLIRLVKMTRALRLMRLISFLTSLRETLLSFVDTLGCLFWSFVAMAFVMYISAILFMQAISFGIEQGEPPSDEIRVKFKSTSSSMLTLFSAFTGGEDWYYLVEGFNEKSWLGLLSKYVFVFYIYFMMFGFVNAIIGVVCSRVSDARCQDEDLIVAKEESKYMAIIQKVMDVFHAMGLKCDERITRECFSNYVRSSKSLALRGIPGFHGLQFFSVDKLWHILTLSSASPDGTNEDTVDLAGFVLAILRLSGDVSTTDLVLLASDIERIDRRLEREIHALKRGIRQIDALKDDLGAMVMHEVKSRQENSLQL